MTIAQPAPTASPPTPKLDAPGAGIPFPARLFLRFWLNPFVAGKEDPARSRHRFDRLHEKIREVYLSIPEAQRTARVLVRPIRGLEDSSRFWSAAMVLEHLEIVGSGIGEIIVSLSNEIVPDLKPDTAAVKPLGSRSGEEALLAYEKLQKNLMPSVESRIGNLSAKARLDHPWFGPFTARKWYWLLGIHAGIHLDQIQQIRNELSKVAPCEHRISG